MTSEGEGSNASNSMSLAEKVKGRVLADVRNASRSMEVEAEVMLQVEEAYRKANGAAAEVRRAIRSEKAAKDRLSESRLREKVAVADSRRASRDEAKADEELKRREGKLAAQLNKVAKAHEHGRMPNVTGRDEAKQQVGEAEQRARGVHAEADRVRAALVASIADVKAAEEGAKQALAWIQTCRGVEAAAWGKVAHTEDDARKAMLETQTALDIQSRAKKNMDLAIKSLKTVMRNEDRIARSAEVDAALATREHQESKGNIVSIAQRLASTIDVLFHHPATTTIEDTESAGSPDLETPETQDTGMPLADMDEIAEKQAANQPSIELLEGIVRLTIMGPTDFSRMKKLRTRLERAGGCRVKSVGGSSGEGTSITVQTEEAIPLMERIKDLEFVEWASKKGKDIEVTLKPFSEAPTRRARSESRVGSPAAT